MVLEPELDSEGVVNIWGTCFHRMVILYSDTAGSSILGMRIRIKDKGTSRSTCIPFPSVLNPHTTTIHPLEGRTKHTEPFTFIGIMVNSDSWPNLSLSHSVFVCARDL